eukprot:5631930-Karenia_brevis.AAC.1
MGLQKLKLGPNRSPRSKHRSEDSQTIKNGLEMAQNSKKYFQDDDDDDYDDADDDDDDAQA